MLGHCMISRWIRLFPGWPCFLLFTLQSSELPLVTSLPTTAALLCDQNNFSPQILTVGSALDVRPAALEPSHTFVGLCLSPMNAHTNSDLSCWKQSRQQGMQISSVSHRTAVRSTVFYNTVMAARPAGSHKCQEDGGEPTELLTVWKHGGSWMSPQLTLLFYLSGEHLLALFGVFTGGF